MSKLLSYEDRLIIAKRLQENASFGEIGKEPGRDQTTLSVTLFLTSELNGV